MWSIVRYSCWSGEEALSGSYSEPFARDVFRLRRFHSTSLRLLAFFRRREPNTFAGQPNALTPRLTIRLTSYLCPLRKCTQQRKHETRMLYGARYLAFDASSLRWKVFSLMVSASKPGTGLWLRLLRSSFNFDKLSARLEHWHSVSIVLNISMLII